MGQGIVSEKRFFKDLLPDSEYDQIVLENEKYYTIECYRKIKGEMSNWKHFYETLERRHGKALMELYSITDNGINFIVYLRKEV